LEIADPLELESDVVQQMVLYWVCDGEDLEKVMDKNSDVPLLQYFIQVMQWFELLS